jgi:hypothetical protein
MPTLSFASFFVLPVIVSIAVMSPQIMKYLDDNVGWFLGSTKPQIGNLTGNLLFIENLVLVSSVYFPLKLFTGKTPTGMNIPTWLSGHIFDYFFLVLPVLFLTIVISYGVTLIIRTLSIGMSTLLSSLFDIATWNAMRDLVFGSDLAGESAFDASANPSWAASCKPLPQPLSDELITFVNQEAIKSLPKIRQSVYELAFSMGTGRPAGFIQNYLSWNELIHTSYFDVPQFRKLLGFAISMSKGFRATQSFKNDGEFPVVMGWFEETVVDPISLRQNGALDAKNPHAGSPHHSILDP